MVSSSRIFVDVTQLVHWPGRLSGIPRVIQELSVRFYESNEFNTIFVSWSKETNKFYEIDLTASINNRGHGIVYLPAKSNNNESNSSSVNSNLLKPIAKKVITHIGKVNKKLSNKLLIEAAKVVSANNKVAEPKKGDFVFIQHGEWWDEGYKKYIEDLSKKGIKIWQVIHDMLPIITPQYSGHATESFTDYCSRILPICDQVLAISESTRRDIIKWLESQKLRCPKIDVFRLGEDFSFAESVAPKDKVFKASGLKGDDFLLTVGTIEARKNHTLLYYVYKQAAIKGIKLPPILLVGRPGWKTDNIVDIVRADPETKDLLLFMMDVSDGELSWLYDHSLFSVYPSFYEGWGLPIAESIARGVPCVCSNTSSMNEIAEDYVVHFSPASTDECLSAIIDMLEPKRRKIYVDKAKDYKSTSWDSSFAKVSKLIKEVS